MTVHLVDVHLLDGFEFGTLTLQLSCQLATDRAWLDKTGLVALHLLPQTLLVLFHMSCQSFNVLLQFFNWHLLLYLLPLLSLLVPFQYPFPVSPFLLFLSELHLQLFPYLSFSHPFFLSFFPLHSPLFLQIFHMFTGIFFNLRYFQM